MEVRSVYEKGRVNLNITYNINILALHDKPGQTTAISVTAEKGYGLYSTFWISQEN